MKKYIITSILGLLSLTSCNLDENINPNKPVASSISPGKRMATAQTSSYAVQARTMNALGNIWMNSWSGNVHQYGNPATNEQDLTITSGFYTGVWSDSYRAIARFQAIIDTENPERYPFHIAISKVLKAYYMQYIVDLYGDVPYSEAFKQANLVTPKYDDDAEVYQALANELYDAIRLIDSTSPSADINVSAAEDVMLKGSMADWKRFANTVLLKMAVRLSKTTDAKGIALRNEIVSKIASAQFLNKNVTINPGYSSGVAANQNPLYNGFGRLTATGGSNTGGYLLYRASDHIVKTLTGHSSKVSSGVEDPRAGFLFTRATEYCTGNSAFAGLVQGALKEADDCGSSRRANSNYSGFGGIFAQSNAVGSAVDGYVMTLAESEFLQAEAALYFPGSFSNGKVHFEEGVKASFAFDGLTTQEAQGYLAAIASKSKVGWVGSIEDQIAAVQYQRWIALTNYNGIEIFINYKRTGYPETPLSVSTSRSEKPYRLVYPSSEYTSNASNVPVMTGEDIFTKNDFTPFWYK